MLNPVNLNKIQNLEIKELYPFLSVLLIIIALFINVLLEMEVRRTEYLVIQSHKDYQALKDEYHLQIAQYAEKTSLSLLHKAALKKLTLKNLKPYQIIPVNEKNLSKDQNRK